MSRGASRSTSHGAALNAAAPWLVAIFSCLLLLVVYQETVATMVSTWLSSETFTHGFIILPISLWLIWRKRRVLQRLPVMPLRGAPLLLSLTLFLLAGACWLVANLVDVNVLQQCALVAFLILTVWTLCGTDIVRALAFPLGFLFLAVPIGTGLEPPMIELTATWTVRLIQWTGIPVFREGNNFALPSGNWSVVQACSGVRYLIASFTLGLLFAYLSYRGFWRRIAFVIASIVVPIVANVLRAYGIVMLGHLSNMQLATGVDHLIYGWIFFGVVMLLLFWVGGFWADPVPLNQSDQTTDSTATHQQAEPAAGHSRGRDLPSVPATLLLLVVVLAMETFPVLVVRGLGGDQNVCDARSLVAPVPEQGWELSEQRAGQVSLGGSVWTPTPTLADRTISVRYRSPGGDARPDGVGQTDSRVSPSGNAAAVGSQHTRVHTGTPGEQNVYVFLQQYLRQQPGAELVTYGNPWYERGSGWRLTDRQSLSGVWAGAGSVEQVVLHHHANDEWLLAWSWFHVAGRDTANPYIAKLLEAWRQLRFADRTGARLFVATPVSIGFEHGAQDRLRAFMSSHERAISEALASGLSGGSQSRACR